MDIKNLTGLEKPLTKLIETVGEGLGVIGNDIFKFDAKKVKRIGEAEAEAEKLKIVKKAEGEAEALEIFSRAGKRFMIEQYNRQINLENIIVCSKEYLPVKVSSEPVDKDWSAKFVSVAQEVSREEVQDLLARILAKEVAMPNSYSLRTLDVIRNLSRNELEEFKKFIALSGNGGFFHINGANREPLRKYDLEFGKFIQLAEAGLFNPSTTLSLQIEFNKSIPTIINSGGINFIVTCETDKKINLGIIKFTEIGSQIYELLKASSTSDKLELYLTDFEDYLKKQELSSSRIAK